MRVPIKEPTGQTYWQEINMINMPPDLVQALGIIGIKPERITEWAWNTDRGGYDVRLEPYAGAVTMSINVLPVREGDQSG